MKDVTKQIPNLGGLPQSNMFDAIPDFTKAIHVRENLQENEDHLNANRQKFTGQAAIILSLLQKGVVLSSYTAMTQYHIGHLARRIKDIRDQMKIHVDDQFQYSDDGKTTQTKIWFIREALSEATIVKYRIGWKPEPKKKKSERK